MKYNEKQKAIKMRRNGKSYREIIEMVNVSKSTLSLWLRDIPLTESQHKELYVTRKQKNAYRLAKIKRKNKQNNIKIINDLAHIDIKTKINDKLFLSGLMLYWAEGDKSKDVELVKFSNSDPYMIKFMMRWFREICKVPEDRFRIALHIHEIHNEKSIKKYWSKITKIPITQFHKTWIKKSTIKHRKKMLYQGTCSIRISNCMLFRQIDAWQNAYKGMIDKV